MPATIFPACKSVYQAGWLAVCCAVVAAVLVSLTCGVVAVQEDLFKLCLRNDVRHTAIAGCTGRRAATRGRAGHHRGGAGAGAGSRRGWWAA